MYLNPLSLIAYNVLYKQLFRRIYSHLLQSSFIIGLSLNLNVVP